MYTRGPWLASKMPNILMNVFSSRSSTTLRDNMEPGGSNYPEVSESSEIFSQHHSGSHGSTKLGCSKKTVALVVVIGLVVVIAVIMTTAGMSTKAARRQSANSAALKTARSAGSKVETLRASAHLSALRDVNSSNDASKLIVPTLNDFLNGAYSSTPFRGKWISGTKFSQRGDDGSFVSQDVVTGQIEVLVPSEVLANLSISQQIVSPDGKKVMLLTDVHRIYRYSKLARYYIYDVDTKRIDFLTPNPSNHLSLMLAEWAPTSNAIAYVFNANIFYQTLPISRQNPPVRLTEDGINGMVFNGIADWVYEEEVLSTAQAMWFNEDGTALAYAQFNDTEVPLMEFPIYGPLTEDNLYPEIYQLHYPKAGTSNPSIALYAVDLGALKGQKEVLVSKMRVPRQLHPVEHYFTLAAWQPNAGGGKLMVTWMNRNQNVSLYTLCAGNHGEEWECEIQHTDSVQGGWSEPYTMPVFSLDGSAFLQILPANEGDSGRFSHIQLLELTTNQLTQVSTGALTVTKILYWRESTGAIFFMAAPLAHPSQRHLYRVMDPRVQARIVASPKSRHLSASKQGSVECLSCDWINSQGQPCLHASVDMSKDGSHFVFECQGPLAPSEYYLYETDTLKKLATLLTNDEVYQDLQTLDLPVQMDLEVEVGQRKQKSFTAKVRLLLPPSYGRRKRQPGQEPKKYPMIVYTYGGPNSQIVKDVYRGVDWGTVLVSGHDIIYAMIDGRGSGFRGNELLFTLRHGLGTFEVEDQIAVARHLKQTYDFIDPDRVGIWGWSYGGFVSSSALSKDGGDVFKCGVSVAPVTNWLYYDSIYTERYMGLPEDFPEAYENSDVTSNPEGFKNKLFYLIHGNADDNVHYQQSMMLSKALEMHDVLFRQQSYPDENHSLGGVQRHLYHSMLQFWTKECFEMTS